MLALALQRITLLSLFSLPFICAQSDSDGYTGYSLQQRGDSNSTVYNTTSTPSNASAVTEPDVFLNASVHVGEIDITVENLTAKINLDAQVLELLQFNAGVDLSINKVELLIQEVDASVLLEARLENVVTMVSDVLDSIDLNPILVTLGQDLSSIVNNTVGILTDNVDTDSTLQSRSFVLEENILYSVNDYSGSTHTNRVLTQSGSIVDQFLDNDGRLLSQKTVGSYLKDMSFNGHNSSLVRNGQVVRELEYMYTPFPGLSVVSAIFFNNAGSVVGTQVLSEASAGGSSSISGQ